VTTLLDRLAGQKLLVVTGKGGVGKSAVAATLGRLLCAAGKRVLLLEIDPRESLYALLGVPPTGGQVVDVEPGLAVQNLQPRAVLNEVVAERLPIRMLVDRVLRSEIYRHFADGAPGLKEMAVLGHALRIVRGLAGPEAPQADLVILDAPATGHGISLLSAPGLVAEVIRDGPFGAMGVELAAFVADPAACGVVVVTLAEEMPVQETIELLATMRDRLGRGPEVVVVNGLYPTIDGRIEGLAAGDPAVELWIRRREVNDAELSRLSSVWDGPRALLPLVPRDRGPDLVEALEISLAAELDREPRGVAP